MVPQALLVLSLLAAPPVPPPGGLVASPEHVALGAKLAFDTRLSDNGRVSCATCHDPKFGWSDGLPVAVGVRAGVGDRNTPTLIGAAYSPRQFWDARTEGTLRQALLPIENPIEMGRQNVGQVLQRLRAVPQYQLDFLEAYGPNPTGGSVITSERLGHAIAAWEASLTTFGAPIDKRLEGDVRALSADAEKGYALFKRANCTQCHPPPLFTDFAVHNDGTEYATNPRLSDRGVAGVVNRNLPGTVRAFKTPSLREIHRTAPYGHNGRFATLDAVLRHYNSGGVRAVDGTRDPFISPLIVPLGYNDEQLRLLKVFLIEGLASPYYNDQRPRVP